MSLHRPNTFRSSPTHLLSAGLLLLAIVPAGTGGSDQ